MESHKTVDSSPESSTDNFKSTLTSKHPVKLALAIGNSRLHWALFAGETLQEMWDTEPIQVDALQQLSSQEKTEYLVQTVNGSIEQTASKNILNFVTTPAPNIRSTPTLHLPLVLASVVPQQTALWENYPGVRVLTLDKLPLQGLYSSLGIDRALALLGAGTKLGWPILVIDAGTALTFTGADVNQHLVGGAILPGLWLQLSSLGAKTASLPSVSLPENLPQRWAADTASAIQSGVVRVAVAGVRDFIEDWQRLFPSSKIALTGGDRTLLLKYLKEAFPDTVSAVIEAPAAIFWGMEIVDS
ncbi:MAG: pantothenate kinase [Oscillatoriaceae cyanobacterium Prado104]|jgi:type III pantothenate kinase|nr:pantothenate kinase [Oscillatoriaceae cyanobacterium Prado104]